MTLLDSITETLAPVHRAGWPLVAGFAAATALLFWIWAPLGVIGLAFTGWCAYFFRDPVRTTPAREGLVVSPADGRVLAPVQAPPPAELGMGEAPRTRISVFMSVFDVHVNRAPMDGTVVAKSYRPGKFVAASLDKASADNERMAIRLRPAGAPDDGARDLAVVQIAGLVARRILCFVGEGDGLRAGQRFGLIRFGSRLDVYLPPGVAPLVAAGQRAIAGETVLADFRAQEPARTGERR